MPSRIHHTESFDKRPIAKGLAKGTPLSLRITRGSPYSSKCRVKATSTGRDATELSAVVPITKRLKESWAVSGKQSSLFVRRNWPLKSVLHTSLGARATVRLPESIGSPGPVLRRRCGFTQPSRRKSSPMELAAGQCFSGNLLLRTTRSFFGPQVGCFSLRERGSRA